MISSRLLQDLDADVKDKAIKFMSLCQHELGVDILVTSTYRDFAAQDQLYAQGRTIPGKIVTNAKGGQSSHNFRRAFDFVPLRNGKPTWNELNLIRQCGEIGEKCDLEWAGRWKTFKELLHFQDLKGRTLEQWRLDHG